MRYFVEKGKFPGNDITYVFTRDNYTYRQYKEDCERLSNAIRKRKGLASMYGAAPLRINDEIIYTMYLNPN